MKSVYKLIFASTLIFFSAWEMNSYAQTENHLKINEVKILKTSECDSDSRTLNQEIVVHHNLLLSTKNDSIICRKGAWQQSFPIAESPQRINLSGLNCDLLRSKVQVFLKSRPGEILETNAIGRFLTINALSSSSCRVENNSFDLNVSVSYNPGLDNSQNEDTVRVIFQVIDSNVVIAESISPKFKFARTVDQSFNLISTGKILTVKVILESTNLLGTTRRNDSAQQEFEAPTPCLNCRILGVGKLGPPVCQNDSIFNQDVEVKYIYYANNEPDTLIVKHKEDILLEQGLDFSTDSGSVRVTLRNLKANGRPCNLVFYFKNRPDCRLEIAPLFDAPKICLNIGLIQMVNAGGNVLAEYLPNQGEETIIPIEFIADFPDNHEISFQVIPQPGKVRTVWMLLARNDTNIQQTFELFAPYSLFGNKGLKNYNVEAFDLQESYVLTATPYKKEFPQGEGITAQFAFRLVGAETDSNLTGIDQEVKAFQLYPNPSDGTIWVSYEDEDAPGAFFIYDHYGSLVYTQSFQGAFKEEIHLKKQGLDEGLYIIKLINNEGSFTKIFKVD